MLLPHKTLAEIMVEHAHRQNRPAIVVQAAAERRFEDAAWHGGHNDEHELIAAEVTAHGINTALTRAINRLNTRIDYMVDFADKGMYEAAAWEQGHAQAGIYHLDLVGIDADATAVNRYDFLALARERATI